MKQIDFAKGNTSANIFKTAFPLMAAQFLSLLYNIVDRIFIARIPGTGTAALGAVGLSFPIIMIITAFTNLYGIGGSPLFSIELGKGNREESEKLMCTSFLLLISTAVLLTVLFEVFARPILMIAGASDTSIGTALPYLRIYLIGTIFTMLASGLNPFINAQGFPVIGMGTIMVGAVSNLILDPIFIFVLGMEVKGAALATVISQTLSAIFALSFLFGKKTDIRLRFLTWDEIRTGRKRMLDIISLGTASFIMQFTNSLVTFACNSVLQSFGGDLAVSVMTLVSSVRQILDTPTISFADGASPIISFNYGAKKPAAIRTAIKTTTAICIGYTAVIWLLVVLIPNFFISIFSRDAALMEPAAAALKIYFFAFIFQALQYSGQTVFKALGKKKHAIFFSIFRKVIIVVPLTYWLPHLMNLGTNGVFMAEPISNFIGGSACFITMLLTVLPELSRMEKKNRTQS